MTILPLAQPQHKFLLVWATRLPLVRLNSWVAVTGEPEPRPQRLSGCCRQGTHSCTLRLWRSCWRMTRRWYAWLPQLPLERPAQQQPYTVQASWIQSAREPGKQLRRHSAGWEPQRALMPMRWQSSCRTVTGRCRPLRRAPSPRSVPLQRTVVQPSLLAAHRWRALRLPRPLRALAGRPVRRPPPGCSAPRSQECGATLRRRWVPRGLGQARHTEQR
mmetsp:Transcript_87952/g.278090  ORF Transcript_87952/g.278090 Transcript_87952/m.278090 type:complete len:217 (+) Transcript_87952:482-1132(+)